MVSNNQRFFPSALNPDQKRRFLLFAVLYVVLWISTWYFARLLSNLGGVSLWFLPAGLRYCCLLVFGWYGVVLELAVQFGFALMQLTALEGVPITDFFSVNTLWRLYNLLASLVLSAAVILPLRARVGRPLDFSRRSHSALFLGSALVVSALSALAGVFGLCQLGFITSVQTPEVFSGWLIGDFIGIITLGPFLLVRIAPTLQHYLIHGRQRGQRKPRVAIGTADLRATLLIILGLGLVIGLPWFLNLAQTQQFPLIALLLLLPLAGVALYYGLRVTALAIILLDSGLVLLISLFSHQGYALQFQIVMIAIALVGLWLGGAVEAHSRILARYRDFASVSNDLLWETDGKSNLIEISGRIAEKFNLSPGQSWRTVLGEGPQPHLAEINDAIAQKQPFRNLEVVLIGSGGTPVWAQLNGLPLLDETGELVGYRGTAVDISRSREAEELLRNYNERLLTEVAERTRDLHQSNAELATKERHLQVLLAAAPVGVLELDEDQRCRFINVNGCLLAGCTQKEAQGRHILDFIHSADRDHADFVMKINRQSDDIHWLEFRLARTHQRCSAHWINLSYADQALDGTVMILTNATARSRQDERLWTLAHHDALTDLPNRNLFWDRLGQALRHAKRRESGAAVLWLDLDGFKSVNDTLGHAAGDVLLQQVALRLKSRVRDSDTVARLGGDEFAVIMPDISEIEGAEQIASAMITSLSAPFDLPQGVVSITCSIGVALYPQHALTVESLTQRADMAMYHAKNAGKNRIQTWHETCQHA